MIPTPTPLPDYSTAPIEIDISLWDSAPTAVQFWNTLPEATVAFQGIIILFLAMAIIMMLIGIGNRITTDE
jgi:hypothetical protein